VPEPPNDLVLARKEYRKYVNNFGQLKMSLKKEFVHYHIKQECLKSKDSAFDPHNIIVTGHIRSDLQDIHKDMIRHHWTHQIRHHWTHQIRHHWTHQIRHHWTDQIRPSRYSQGHDQTKYAASSVNIYYSK
jgi:hypothetical protein